MVTLDNDASVPVEMGAAVCDGGGSILFINETMQRWLGESERMHRKRKDVIFPKKKISSVSGSRNAADWNVSLDEQQLHLRAYPVMHPSMPTAVIVIGYSSLPFERMKNRLNRLKEYADEWEAMFQNSYDAIYIVDKNGITLKTNDAIERLTGIPKEYFIGKDLRYLEQRGIVQKSVSFEVMKQKKPVTAIQENALGKVLSITGSPVFDSRGEVTRIVTNVRDISELTRLREELNRLRKFHAGEEDQPVVVSRSMKQVIDLAKRVSDKDTTVLLLGESGVGKEVVARMIHQNSSRYEKGSFIKVNCGAIPQELLESELFGYEPGAFTGAKKGGKPGMFELAHDGTLFLDEIGELPLHLQVKLLQVLQEQAFHRVGGLKTIRVNVRIIAATNRNLQKMVEDGTFREDLYYRLYVVPIEIPPLRERRDDILPLVRFYLQKCNRKYAADKIMSKETLQMLQAYSWPGNVRELANLIERIIVTTPSREIRPEHLPNLTGGTPRSVLEDSPYTVLYAAGLQAAVEKLEKEILEDAYSKYGSSYEVAKALHISQATAIRKAYKYGIRDKKN